MKEPASIGIELAEEASIWDALESAAATLIEVNRRRQRSGLPLVRGSKITLQLQPVTVLESDAPLEAIAIAYGLYAGQPYRTVYQVRCNCSTAFLRATGVACKEIDDTQLSAVAEMIIRTRRHCEF